MGSARVLGQAVLGAVAIAACLAATGARAQELSAADRAAAAQAYDRASAAYLAGQYDRAASLFETAYRVLPNATALLQAARAHERASHPARGATLASRILTRYGDSAEVAEATTLLETLRSGLAQIELSADQTREWEIDGALQDAEDSLVFVEPGEHRVRVTFGTGVVEELVSGGPGELIRLEVEAPPEAAVEAEPEPLERGPVEVTPVAHEDGGGVSPWVFGALVGATGVAAGFLVAFGVDAWSGLDDYRTAPTRAGLEDGQARELRTNVMFGVAGGLAIAALIVGLVTDWGTDDDVSVTVGVASEAGFLALQGSFP